MKTFTAKDFSRCPAKVYEAAREDGKVEVTHDRFPHKFTLIYRDIENYNLIDLGITQQDIDSARRILIDSDLIPKNQLTEEEKLYLKNKKAPD